MKYALDGMHNWGWVSSFSQLKTGPKHSGDCIIGKLRLAKKGGVNGKLSVLYLLGDESRKEVDDVKGGDVGPPLGV